MLMVADSFRALRFGELVRVYQDSLEEAAQQWSNLPQGFALQQAEQDFRQYLQDVFFRTPDAVCAVWIEHENYVSALRLEPYRDGLLLEGLETTPDHRKKGYARSLIGAVQQYLSRQGPVKLYSHVGKQNMASMNVHKCCGFRRISDHAVYISGSVDYRCATLLYECEKSCIS